MIFRQFLHVDPVIAASYLSGCGDKTNLGMAQNALEWIGP